MAWYKVASQSLISLHIVSYHACSDRSTATSLPPLFSLSLIHPPPIYPSIRSPTHPRHQGNTNTETHIHVPAERTADRCLASRRSTTLCYTIPYHTIPYHVTPHLTKPHHTPSHDPHRQLKPLPINLLHLPQSPPTSHIHQQQASK